MRPSKISRIKNDEDEERRQKRIVKLGRSRTLNALTRTINAGRSGTYNDGHWKIGIYLWAPLSGTKGYTWQVKVMCGLIFLAICLLSSSFYNLSASGDYRHLSFPFCKVSLPRINLVILFPSLPLSSKFPFPKLVHSLNKNLSSSTYNSKEASLI